MSPLVKDYLHLHFIVWIWGFTAILGLLITIPALEIVFYRTLFAFVTLGMMLVLAKRFPRLPPKDILKMVGIGLLIGTHWTLFFAAARVANVSVCLVGMATCAFWTSLLDPLMSRRKILWYEIALGLLVVIGLYIVFRFEGDYTVGLIMAIISSIFAAIFSILNSYITHRHSHYVITFYEMFGAWLMTVIFIPVYLLFFADHGLQLSISWMDLLYLAILAFICTVYAYSASVELMKRISAFAVNLTYNLEPVYGIILAVLIFGESEKMTPEFYMGGIVILISVLAYPVLNWFYRRKALQVDNLR